MISPETPDELQSDARFARGVPQILVVEDEVLVGWSLANAFRKLGMEVTIVDSGEKAIDALPSVHFDLIITDLKLPRIDGFEVAAAVKSAYRDTPVIMMSAIEDPAAGEKSGRSIDAFIEKPFDLKEMTAIAGKLLAARAHRSKPA